MSGRSQALTRTRCPACGTVFRVTSEQLRLKAGKVRCGNCQTVFNAFDHFQVEEQPPEAEPARVEALPEPLAESTEQSTQAAREAGLVAVRELADSNAHNRWSAGPLINDGLGAFDEPAEKSPAWPYVLVFFLALLALCAQFALHYRTEIVQHSPALAGTYAALGIDVPLPRKLALVSIESSDLQADDARGLFVLNATLKNRALHAQAWPSLELTLTDINDRVIARRIIAAPDYLPAGVSADVFPGNAETGIRLWIDASDIGAAGYRLNLFYL